MRTDLFSNNFADLIVHFDDGQTMTYKIRLAEISMQQRAYNVVEWEDSGHTRGINRVLGSEEILIRGFLQERALLLPQAAEPGDTIRRIRRPFKHRSGGKNEIP